ncbi:MAG: hypothetical protein RL226_2225 [Bacteroidota bacterium]
MRRFILPTLAVLMIIASAFTLSNSLEIGQQAPSTDHKMTGLDGKAQTLQTLKQENGLLVIFSCNTCPFVVGRGEQSQGWENRYNALHALASSSGVGMVLVNSNEAKRTGDDSLEAMREHAKDQGYTMPYVVDHNHVLADAFDARTTPHVYLFNGNMELVYKGAIDDNVDNASEVKENYLQNAIRQMTSGRAIDVSTTKPLGCSIKRVG